MTKFYTGEYMPSLIEKIFEIFPFRLLFSVVIGGCIFALTSSDNAMLLKFGKTCYIVFVALISFLILSLILWIYSLIKRHRTNLKNKEINNKCLLEKIDEARKNLYRVTDLWSDFDIKALRNFVINDNKELKVKGYISDTSGLFNNYYAHSKTETKVVKNKGDSLPEYQPYTIYWLDESFYNYVKIIFDVYGKVSKFDKG